MSKKPRCKECKHLRGPRRLGRTVVDKDGSQRSKKAPCGCKCHRQESTSIE